MRWMIGLLFTLVVVVGPARAQERSRGKLVLDLWEAAYLPGGKAGYVHTTTREFEKDGRTLLRTTKEMHLTVRRYEQTIQLRMDQATDETPQGAVVGTLMRQYLPKGKQLTITGTVEGRQIHLVQDGTHELRPAPWNDKAIGLYKQYKLFQQRKVHPGDEFSFLSFEPSINLVIRIQVQVKDYEEVAIPEAKGRQRLLRVEARSEKIENFQLPTVVYWLDDELLPVRQQFELPGLGTITQQKTTRELARLTGPAANLTDIGLQSYVRLRQRITNPYDRRQLTYRVTVRGDDDPSSTFSRDDRQQVRNLRGSTFDLIVHAGRRPGPDAEEDDEKMPGEEFIQSSYFITSADRKVQALARQAVGEEGDPWRKALRIERWVHEHMASRGDVALATADHVARTLQGDCRQHAMLMAAMCRAAGVPSRTAIGLIYADTRATRGPVFAFHMWTEVWVGGRWVPLDATLGRGHVGATHLKVTDASWHDTRSLTPLLPVLRVLGKLSIEVVGGS